MHIPRWKKYLSYLLDINIESTTSEHNPVLDIVLKNGRLQLCTKNAVYSFEDKYDNFKKAFDKIDWDHFPGNHVLVLGLGLGSIIQLLESVFKQEFSYTGIEIDETVSLLANRYILPKIKSPLQIIHADAHYYLKSMDEKFDLICMDIFEDDLIPAKFQETDFLKLLKDRLSPNGMILYNSLAYTREDRQLSRLFYEKKFKTIFPDGKLLKVKGNYMFVNNDKYLRS